MRLSELTKRQISQLAERFNATKTEIMSIAIERMYREETGKMNEQELLKLATDRVENDETLAPYRDLLVNYDWQEGGEHLTWVLTAPSQELIDWAEGVRDDERMQERIEAQQAAELADLE